MRVGAAHGGSLILKDLNVLDEGVLGWNLLVDLLPAPDDRDDVLIRRERRRAELCQSEVMLRVEANDVASAAGGLGLEERMLVLLLGDLLRHESGVVVLKEECGCVVVVLGAGSACVARTKVALFVVGGERGALRLFLLALPRTLGAVRRAEDPAARQGVETAVRMLGGIEFGKRLAMGGVGSTIGMGGPIDESVRVAISMAFSMAVSMAVRMAICVAAAVGRDSVHDGYRCRVRLRCDLRLENEIDPGSQLNEEISV